MKPLPVRPMPTPQIRFHVSSSQTLARQSRRLFGREEKAREGPSLAHGRVADYWPGNRVSTWRDAQLAGQDIARQVVKPTQDGCGVLARFISPLPAWYVLEEQARFPIAGPGMEDRRSR